MTTCKPATPPLPICDAMGYNQITGRETSHRTPPTMGVLTDTLRATLHELAQSDARLYRGLADELGATPRRLPADDITAAIALLKAHGYTVTPPRG